MLIDFLGEVMKQNHRDSELDQLIGQNVRITFYRGSWIEGLLIYNEKCEAPRYLNINMYYIIRSNGSYMGFRKTQVRKAERINVANV